jgi:hypothetical protein
MHTLPGSLEKRQVHIPCHPPSLVFSWRVFPGRISRMGDGASRVPVSRATGGTMLNRVCSVLAIGLALSFTGLACSRTPMDEQQADKCATDQLTKTCVTDDDCTLSNVVSPIYSPADCVCLPCPMPVNKTPVVDCQNEWDQVCGPVCNGRHDEYPPPCPVVAACSQGYCIGLGPD